MPPLLLATKLYIPPARPQMVARPRLTERLSAGLAAGRPAGVTLISAPAGFGKTTLLSEWGQISQDEGSRNDESRATLHPFLFAWLSLDDGDNDPARFLSYLVAAVQTA